MVLYNTLILRGTYEHIYTVKKELETLSSKDKKQSKLYNEKTTKFFKKLQILEEKEIDYQYNLKVQFLYTKGNIEEFINQFYAYNVEVIHMCENEKQHIWIVNKREYIQTYQLIPEFAIHEVLYDYMNYKESAIVLDNFQTIKFDRNSHEVVIDDQKQNYHELLDLLYNQNVKGKPFHEILEQFISNYHEKCINSYNNLYSINKEMDSREEPSPLALFIVTFGVIGIIAVLLFFMGYL